MQYLIILIESFALAILITLALSLYTVWWAWRKVEMVNLRNFEDLRRLMADLIRWHYQPFFIGHREWHNMISGVEPPDAHEKFLIEAALVASRRQREIMALRYPGLVDAVVKYQAEQAGLKR